MMCIVMVVLMLIVAVTSHSINEPKLEFKVNDERCDMAKLGSLTIYECDSDIDARGFIDEGAICWITIEETSNAGLITVDVVNPLTRRTCLHGDWLYTGSLRKHKISKRGWWRRRRRNDQQTVTVYVTQTPPKFDTCQPADLQQEYNPASGQTSVEVTWTTPVASDTDSTTAPTVTQDEGSPSGSSFEGTVSGKQHTIRYIATDSDGLTASCYFSFNVKVSSCSSIVWPSNGYVNCPDSQNGHISGSSCTFYCNDGYLISGTSTVTCENSASPTWSIAPTCDKIECSAPATLEKGYAECEDTSYPYSSACTWQCYDGYRLHGNLYIQCEADGQWTSSDQPTCIDDIAPTLECVTPQTFYADRGLTNTAVTWQLPTVTDIIDTAPTLTQTEGPAIGSALELGSSIVKYKASDYAGNESPECTIELRVEEIKCSHPLDTLNDNNMAFNCTGVTYSYGDTCTLTCNYNLPLNGTDIITCEKQGPGDNPTGVWDWGTGHQPICEEIECPELDPPLNGALVDNSFNQRPTSTIMCNENFDIPELSTTIAYSGLYLCYDDGTWGPLSYVPDCSEERNPRFISLPSEIYYYSGDCYTEETQEQIRQNVQTIINSTLAQLCPTGETCYIGETTIRCGPTSRRKRRRRAFVLQREDNNQQAIKYKNTFVHSLDKRQASTDLLELTFPINVMWNRGSGSLNDAYGHHDAVHAVLKNAVQSLLDNGNLTISGFTIESDSFQTASYSSLVCDDNEYLVAQKGYCMPCPAGHYLVDNKCARCPVGTFMDEVGSVQCTSCPDGYTTRADGSKSSTDCLEFCVPGYYSPDGLAKCSACPVGTYQDQYQSTNCTKCSMDKTTMSTNSSSASDCQNFDIWFSDTFGQDVTLTNTSNSMQNMVVMFWAKPQGLNTNMALRVTSRSSDFIKIQLTTYIQVEVVSTTNKIVGSFVSTSWTHIAVSTDSTSSSIYVYVNGVLMHEFNGITQSTPYIENGAVVVSSTGTSGVYVSGFHVRNETVSLLNIESQSQECHVISTDDVISMDVFRTLKIQGMTTVVPSSCDAIDECTTSPCGYHTCINEVGGFKCVCSGGYTGDTCTIPPDYCINNDCVSGSTCQSSSTKYTCVCNPGYSGTFCEIAPVNGGWSVWSTWTNCDVTCGSGTQSRVRSCDSPVPDEYGLDCVGDTSETAACSTDECRVCPVLQRSFGTLLNCSTDNITYTQTCYPYCANGLLKPDGLNGLDTYKCGIATNYKWQPMDKVGSCGGATRPDSYLLQVSTRYSSIINDNDKTQLKSTVQSNAATTDCGQTSTCQISTEVTTSARRRRSTESTLTLSFEIPLVQTDSIQLEQYVTDGTVSTTLQEVLDAITVLENTAAYINTASSSIFDVIVNGVTYTSDAVSVQTFDMVMCDIGQAATTTERLCVQCPVGTYVYGSVCRFCDVGSYQPTSGQTECITCPTGVTTTTLGSTDILQCSESIVSSTSTTNSATEPVTVPVSTTPSNNRHIDGTTHSAPVGIYIGIGIAAIALMLSLIAFSIVRFKKHGKRPFRSNSVSSFNNIRPQTGQSTVTGFPMQGIGATPMNTSFYHAHSNKKTDILTIKDLDNEFFAQTSKSPPPPYSVDN